jgi:hypothetical protein
LNLLQSLNDELLIKNEIEISARKTSEKNHQLCYTDKITDKNSIFSFGIIFEAK